MTRARIIVGDCRKSMSDLPDASVDSIVTDPPYELGFMGKGWDASGIAYDVEVWRQARRVLKPGGHLLAFSGSRTYHRMTCAIEDAGFEIRDQIMWVYGSGFPKSLDVSKAIDRAAGIEREVVGTTTAPRKALDRNPADAKYGYKVGEIDVTVPATDDARRWSGWGTALKPAHEPICMARKPLAGTVAANVLRHGTGAINVDRCRIEGNRWPANFIHDGSDEATDGLRDAARFFYTAKTSSEDRDEMIGDLAPKRRAGLQGADREGTLDPLSKRWRTAPRSNHHPTVKPTDLMRYLVRMVTPPGGTVLDPFTGSGSTGRAAMLEGMRFIGCELSPEYAEIARARIRYTLGPMFAHLVV